jgi:hypothetical protein
MTVNLLALAGAILMSVFCIATFSSWFVTGSVFGDSCLARVVLFITGFGAGFMGFWAFQPDNLTNVICIGPLVGLGLGGYAGILVPTIVQRPQKNSQE